MVDMLTCVLPLSCGLLAAAVAAMCAALSGEWLCVPAHGHVAAVNVDVLLRTEHACRFTGSPCRVCACDVLRTCSSHCVLPAVRTQALPSQPQQRLLVLAPHLCSTSPVSNLGAPARSTGRHHPPAQPRRLRAPPPCLPLPPAALRISHGAAACRVREAGYNVDL